MSTMGKEEYLEDRLDDQIKWYGDKAAWNQRWHKRLQVMIIVAGALIPFVSGFESGEIIWTKILVGVLGVVVAALTAILGLYKFQENWIQYRFTCESLKREKHTFLAGVAPYAGDDAFDVLVGRVETLISSENAAWVSRGTATTGGA
jgi:hypothetical protein